MEICKPRANSVWRYMYYNNFRFSQIFTDFSRIYRSLLDTSYCVRDIGSFDAYRNGTCKQNIIVKHIQERFTNKRLRYKLIAALQKPTKSQFIRIDHVTIQTVCFLISVPPNNVVYRM